MQWLWGGGRAWGRAGAAFCDRYLAAILSARRYAGPVRRRVPASLALRLQRASGLCDCLTRSALQCDLLAARFATADFRQSSAVRLPRALDGLLRPRAA